MYVHVACTVMQHVHVCGKGGRGEKVTVAGCSAWPVKGKEWHVMQQKEVCASHTRVCPGGRHAYQNARQQGIGSL